jgi:hypothetical protein
MSEGGKESGVFGTSQLQDAQAAADVKDVSGVKLGLDLAVGGEFDAHG